MNEYRVTWSPLDAEWVATCPAYPSLSWLDESATRALEGIVALVESIDLEVAP